MGFFNKYLRLLLPFVLLWLFMILPPKTQGQITQEIDDLVGWNLVQSPIHSLPTKVQRSLSKVNVPVFWGSTKDLRREKRKKREANRGLRSRWISQEI